MIVEVCANSLESAMNAQKARADRIELCMELGVGGITPSWGLLKQVRQAISIPVHVLVRPRSGDFTYSPHEFEIMLQDVSLCVELGFDGVVSGVLNRDLTIDRDRTQELIRTARGRSFTFHRAFDWVPDPFLALNILQDMGVGTILSSGQRPKAEEGLPLLSLLRQRAVDCTIMPGAGIGPHNVALFKDDGFKAVHLSATKFVGNLPMVPKLSMNTPSFLREDAVAISQIDIVEAVRGLVK
ncbi:MAG: copper homeostasis protein CutC [Sediminicola sp.]|tara:strand:+ start:10417 stop:11139 length:723 start_codon:yes stop_codon:yes gene_type:complete